MIPEIKGTNELRPILPELLIKKDSRSLHKEEKPGRAQVEKNGAANMEIWGQNNGGGRAAQRENSGNIQRFNLVVMGTCV